MILIIIMVFISIVVFIAIIIVFIFCKGKPLAYHQLNSNHSPDRSDSKSESDPKGVNKSAIIQSRGQSMSTNANLRSKDIS